MSKKCRQYRANFKAKVVLPPSRATRPLRRLLPARDPSDHGKPMEARVAG